MTPSTFEPTWELLASSATEQGIISLISQYYCCNKDSLRIEDGCVYNGEKWVRGVCVIKKGKRYRFERAK